MIQPYFSTNDSLTKSNNSNVNKRHQVAIAAGDGIGPEITKAVLHILNAAEAPIDWRHIEIGSNAYRAGHNAGISPEAWASIRQCQTVLKGPITTPQGGGYKSVNVTLRKSLNLFANVRPVQALSPYVPCAHPNLDVVIIRENEEDLYAGIEHRQTPEVHQVLKLITRPGCERIIRYAFEYARSQGRKRVSCMSKDNIMKLTDGLFHKVFDEIALEYPDIVADHHIIDIGAARLADKPEQFDVIVTLNLYGDIISDIAAEIAGSVGMAASSNIGQTAAMFEAIHGSAPDIAGQGLANPSGLLLAATHMLAHLGQGQLAERIANAWLKTIEEGVHTHDMTRASTTKHAATTMDFAEAVVERLGEKPHSLKAASYLRAPIKIHEPKKVITTKHLNGVDLFLCWDKNNRNPEILGQKLLEATTTLGTLIMITNRGIKVYPNGLPETWCSDHWRCRFLIKPATNGPRNIIELMKCVTEAGFEIIKTENLYSFDGTPAYSAAQGQ